MMLLWKALLASKVILTEVGCLGWRWKAYLAMCCSGPPGPLSQPRGHWRDLSIRFIELHHGFHTVVISFTEIQLTYYTIHASKMHSSIAVFLRQPQSSGMIIQFGTFSWSQKESCSLSCHLPNPPMPPQPKASTHLLSVSISASSGHFL